MWRMGGYDWYLVVGLQALRGYLANDAESAKRLRSTECHVGLAAFEHALERHFHARGKKQKKTHEASLEVRQT